jgi:predicted Zn-dependent peptidase
LLPDIPFNDFLIHLPHGLGKIAIRPKEVKTQFLRGNERKDARAATLGTLEMLGLGAAFFEAFPADLGGVTLEEINAYIKNILAPARASWVRIGPKK